MEIPAEADNAPLRSAAIALALAIVGATLASLLGGLRAGRRLARSVASLAEAGVEPLPQRLMRATYDCAEPGGIFVDRVNQANNLGHCRTISASNPCGEQMPPRSQSREHANDSIKLGAVHGYPL